MVGSNEPKTENIRADLWAWLSGTISGLSTLYTLWQTITMHWENALVAVVILVVAGIFFVKRQHRILRAWLVKRLQTVDMVRNYEATVNALGFRGRVLGAVTDFATWIGEFITVGVTREQSKSFERLNNAFIDTLRDLFTQAERIALFEPSLDGTNLVIRFSTRFSPNRPPDLKLPISQSAAGYAFTSGTTFFSTDLEVQANCPYKPLPDSQKIRTLLCVPIKANGHTYAVLSMDSRSPSAMDLDIVELVETLCNAIALAWAFYKTSKEGISHEPI